MASESEKNSVVKRWIGIFLRTLHLIGVAGVGGTFLFKQPLTIGYPYLLLVMISGFGMMIMDILSNVYYLIQVRGLAIIAKLIILLAGYFMGLEAYLLIIVIIISGVISHAPAKMRYYGFIKHTEEKLIINERC